MLRPTNNSARKQLRLPPGVKDFLFDEAQQRRDIERNLLRALAHKDYREIITPTIEYSEVFTHGGDGRVAEEEKTYRFLDRDGNLLALRADFTAQVARIAASRFAQHEAPQRLCYSGKVFRAEQQHAGRSREKWQVGFELLGAQDVAADLEAVNNILNCLAALELHELRLAIGHIGYFNGVLAAAELDAETLHTLKYLVERKAVAGLQEVLPQLALPPAVQAALLQLPQLHGGEEVLAVAQSFAVHDKSLQAVAHLAALVPHVQEPLAAGRLFFDLSEVEGMGYYTGIILRAFVAGAGAEVGSGGRYDELIARFGADMPAVGFSFDVDLLAQAVAEQKRAR